jgi:hypothetical protein
MNGQAEVKFPTSRQGATSAGHSGLFGGGVVVDYFPAIREFAEHQGE